MQSPIEKGYRSTITGVIQSPTHRIIVGIPMTGLVRSEWVMARYGQVIPCNWSQVDAISWMDSFSPLNFLVADARNFTATQAVEKGFEWLLFIDHDVIIPPNFIIRCNERMLENKVPVWSGLYFTKSVPAEPLVYRGRGNGYYNKWKLGEEVWVDGLPMGCTMISVSILKAMYEESEEYEYKGTTIRRIFDTPSNVWYDPEKAEWFKASGTEDLDWCLRVMQQGFFEKAGWGKYQKKKYPFLIDTSLFCRHIEWDGIQYPLPDVCHV